MLKPIEKSSVIQHVVDEVRRFIARSRLRNGTRLPSEHELCRRLRVSRPTVREALKVLETLGLIEKIPGRGAFVRTRGRRIGRQFRAYTEEEIREAGLLAHAVRLLVETKCAFLAAERADARDIAALEAALQRLTKALEAGDVSDAVLGDIAFHNAIARATKNSALLNILAILGPIVTENRRGTRGSFDTGYDLAIPHIRIFEAIKRREPESAAHAMRQHLQDLMRHVPPSYSR
ncbi:MAG: FadR/GntR family transcriptional regulator [Candidatus Methylomirabilales bacterium]